MGCFRERRTASPLCPHPLCYNSPTNCRSQRPAWPLLGQRQGKHLLCSAFPQLHPQIVSGQKMPKDPLTASSRCRLTGSKPTMCKQPLPWLTCRRPQAAQPSEKTLDSGAAMSVYVQIARAAQVGSAASHLQACFLIWGRA